MISNVRSINEDVKSIPQFQSTIAKVCTVFTLISFMSTNCDSTTVLTKDKYYSSVVSSESEVVKFTTNTTSEMNVYNSVLDYKKYKNFGTLKVIEALQSNWNGYGADSFSVDLISKVREFVVSAVIQPDIFPTARDSIQIEYEKDNGDYLEFEFFENGEIKKFFYGSQGETDTQYISFECLNGEIDTFYGRKI